MNISAINSLNEVYQLAKEEISHKKGNITITIDGITHISHSNDIIGNCLQEWLPEWFKDHGLQIEPNNRTQSFPDFFAIFPDGSREAMDIKCWNANNSPAFDIGNFNGLYTEMYNHPDHLFGKYLCIGYVPTNHGFTIEEIYLKTLWGITGPTDTKPLNVQIKKQQIYAIRPSSNFRKNSDKCFKSPKEFLKSMCETRNKYPSNQQDSIPVDKWYEKLGAYIDNYNK